MNREKRAMRDLENLKSRNGGRRSSRGGEVVEVLETSRLKPPAIGWWIGGGRIHEVIRVLSLMVHRRSSSRSLSLPSHSVHQQKIQLSAVRFRVCISEIEYYSASKFPIKLLFSDRPGYNAIGLKQRIWMFVESAGLGLLCLSIVCFPSVLSDQGMTPFLSLPLNSN